MGKRRDDIDNLIMNSVSDINTSEDYNKQLINKINCNNVIKHNAVRQDLSVQSLSFAFRKKLSISFILTGIFFFVISFNTIDYAFYGFKNKLQEINIKADINIKTLDRNFK